MDCEICEIVTLIQRQIVHGTQELPGLWFEHLCGERSSGAAFTETTGSLMLNMFGVSAHQNTVKWPSLPVSKWPADADGCPSRLHQHINSGDVIAHIAHAESRTPFGWTPTTAPLRGRPRAEPGCQSGFLSTTEARLTDGGTDRDSVTSVKRSKVLAAAQLLPRPHHCL